MSIAVAELLDRQRVEGPLKQEIMDKIQTGCVDLMKSCKPTFCSGGKTASNFHINIKCEEINRLADILFIIYGDKLKDVIPSTNRDGLCKVLGGLVDGDVTKLTQMAEMVISNEYPNMTTGNKKILDDYLLKQITPTIKCMCPDIENNPVDNKQSGKYTSTLEINYKVIMLLIGSLLLLVSLIVVPLLIVKRKKWTGENKSLTLTITLILVCLTAFIIISINPMKLFTQRVEGGTDWVPIEGEYTGEGTYPPVTANIDMNIRNDNTVVINSLVCNKPCPPDMLKNCGSGKNILTIDVHNKTKYGYMLKGDCIDQIKKNIKNISSIVTFDSIYIGRKEDGTIFSNVKMGLLGLSPVIYILIKKK